ncbi:hypothetical protein [Mycobacterium simiae]|uniref:hypothetical protein n=1 Tax=Mycobacterium simiae TaxID=1784 RepID=UPI0013D2A1A7|nr:hypothetical protein [Mycobacterium simiae]
MKRASAVLGGTVVLSLAVACGSGGSSLGAPPPTSSTPTSPGTPGPVTSVVPAPGQYPTDGSGTGGGTAGGGAAGG